MNGGKYGSNQWKIRLFYALHVILILAVIGGAGIFVKSKYEAYQVKQEEARKLAEEQRKKAEEEQRAEEERKKEEEERKAEEERKKEEEEKKAEEARKKEEEEQRKKEEEAKKAKEEAARKNISEYEVVLSDATWIEAAKQAESRGGHLAVISSQEEEKAIQTLIEQKGVIHTVWLGGILKDSSFQWVNGEAFQYTNWGPGEPNNETNNELYLDMYNINGVWYWNDAPNDIKQYYTGRMGYVIEWEVEQ